jgi:hypothetical protein
MVVFCEKVVQLPLTGDNMQMLGAVYQDPYAPALSRFDPDEAGRQVGSFGWSVGITFGQRLLAQGVRWEPANRIAVCLSPRLQTGRVGSSRRGPTAGSWEGRDDFLVTVGLSPDTWAQTPALGKRVLLAELGARALLRLCAREAWGWPEAAVSAAVEMFRQDEADLRWAAGTRATGVALPRDAYKRLSLKVWTGLNDRERGELAQAVTRALHAAGRPLQPAGVRAFGPRHDPLSVAQWRDPETGLSFSLICGGIYRPGYSKAQIRQAHVWYSQESPDDESDFYGPGRVSASIWPYHSQLPCDLGRKPTVTVPPMLLACEPLLWSIPGLTRLLDLTKARVYYSPRHGPDPNHEVLPVYFDWPEVPPLLRRYDWSLPGSAEFEWAVRAGRDTLFSWGEEPPDVAPAGAVGSSSFEPDRPRAWPWCNRFGLAAPLTHTTWCLPLDDPNESFPLVWRGGSESWPGQGCGEWWLFLTAVEGRECLDRDLSSGGVLRPAIRLQPGAASADRPS